MSLSVMTTHYLMCERNVEQWYLVIIPCNKKNPLLAMKKKLLLTEQSPVAGKCWQSASCDI